MIQREKLLSKLDKLYEGQHVLFVYGQKGLGKSSLLSHYLGNKDQNYLWISLERQTSLLEILSYEVEFETDGKQLEWVLRKYSKDWKGIDVIVWDNIHYISDSVKELLINFTTSRPQFPKQVFVSDEVISDDFYPIFSRLKTPAFDNEEIELFIEQHQLKISVDELASKTSGIALLMNLYSLGNKGIQRFLDELLKNLSQEIIRGLKKCALLSRSLTKDELISLLVLDNKEDITKLINLGLIQSFNDEDDHYFLTKHIEVFLLDELEVSELESLQAELLDFSEKNTNRSFETLILHLETGNGKKINSYLKELDLNLDLSRLESFSKEFLEEFKTDIEAVLKLNDLNIDSKVTLYRYLMKIYILRGDRAALKEALHHFVQRFIDFSNLSAAKEWFLYEYITLLNTSYFFGISKDVCNEISKIGNERLKILIEIESGVAIMQEDFALAINKFKSILAKVVNSEFAQDEKILGNLHFQLARSYYHSNDDYLALEHFLKASDIFKEGNNLYFHAVSRMNAVWIHLRKEDWSAIKETYDELYPYADQFGHTLVKAGLNLLMAKHERHHLKLCESVTFIDQALSLIGKNSPFYSMRDIYCEKIRISLALDQRILAEELYDKLLQKSMETNQQSDYQIRYLELELRSYDIPVDELLEIWSEIENRENEEAFGLSFQILFSDKFDSVIKTPFYEQFKLERELREMISTGDKALVLKQIQKIRKLISPSQQKIFLSFILDILEMNYLSKVDPDFISRLDCTLMDENLKEQLRHWYGFSNGSSDEKQSFDWSLLRRFDQNRIKSFVNGPQGEAGESYDRYENGKHSLCSSIKENYKKSLKKYIFISELGELWYEGKVNEDLLKRNQLKELIVSFMKSFPDELTKEDITTLVWGENYDPLIHDARIYTAIQRTRSLLDDEVIIKGKEGYIWNHKKNFTLYVKKRCQKTMSNNRNQALIMKCFETSLKNGSAELSRREIVDKTNLSESSIKREISILLDRGALIRLGAGRSVRYKLS